MKSQKVCNKNLECDVNNACVLNCLLSFEAKKLGISYVTFDELLMQSDIIFITCSLNETTKNMMNASAFTKMKNTAVIVNVSRGGNNIILN